MKTLDILKLLYLEPATLTPSQILAVSQVLPKDWQAKTIAPRMGRKERGVYRVKLISK